MEGFLWVLELAAIVFFCFWALKQDSKTNKSGRK